MSDLLANDLRGTDPKTDPDGGSTSLNALAFSTLLSSQETDAHLCEILISRPGLISLFCFRHRRGDFFNLPGVSALSNRLRLDLREPFAGFSI